MIDPPLRLAAADVRAWFAPTRMLADDGRLGRVLAWLTPVELERFHRFRHDVDREMFLLGRVLARTIVARVTGWTPTGWPWREGPHGRPEIDRDGADAGPDADVRFNIAHSAGLVICVVAHGREVGVDVEDLERHATDLEIVGRYCAPTEVADILESGADEWRTRFLHYWTLKEAYLKARGLGIAVPLAEIAFTLAPPTRVAFLGSLAGTSDAWTFHLERVTPRHLVAVAADVTHRPAIIRVDPLPDAWLP